MMKDTENKTDKRTSHLQIRQVETVSQKADESADNYATDLSFMQRAFELAKQADAINEIPVGAVLVDANGNVIGEGFNQSIKLNDPSAHAEMMAIRDAGQNIANYRMLDCTLYVTLEPCPMCAGLLVHSRIKRLVYAAPDTKTGAVDSVFNITCHQNLNHHIDVTYGLMAEQASEMISQFFKRRRAEHKAKKKALKPKS